MTSLRSTGNAARATPSAASALVSAAAPLFSIEEFGSDAVIITSADARDPQPADDWRARLCTSLAAVPGAAAIGAKRIASDGRLASMGEFVIHPKGCHPLGRGLPATAFRFPEEVDAFATGVVMVSGRTFERAGGLRIEHGPLGLVDLCLRIRRDHGRCIAVPDVVVTCDHAQSHLTSEDVRAFADRWGFEVLAADLDAVRDRHRGTGLLWNARFHGQSMPFEKYEERPAVHWRNYERVAPYRQRADHLAMIIRKVSPTGPVVEIGCGDGLFCHLVATKGVETIGYDPEASAIRQAEHETAGQTYPGAPPRFFVGRGEHIDRPDGSCRTIALLDTIEHLPNPVAVLRESARLLAPGGHLVISTPEWQFGGSSDATYHVAEYTEAELANQITAATCMAIANTGRIGGIYRDLIVVATKST